MKITKSQLKELIRNAIVEDMMDKEIENPKTGNKIKIKTALQLPDEHPANKKAKDMVAKSSPEKSDEPTDATPAPKGKPKGPVKNPFSKESPAFEPKQKQIDKKKKPKDEPEDEFDVGGPSYANVPKGVKSSKDIGKTPQPSDFDGDMDKYFDALNKHMKDVEAKLDKGDKPAFKKPSDMGSGQGMMKTGYDEPTAADDVESNWDKSSKEFESLEDKHGVRIDDQSDWSGIENNPRGEYSVSGKNSEDAGDGFSVYSTVETGVDGESYEGNKNIITFPQDDDPFGGQVEIEFDSIGDAKEALDKILSDKKIKSALDGGRADMANNKDYIKKQVEKLGGKTIRESIKESKKRRFTVKEVRMWMKKLEENRYKKVYNSDARRVAWMVNNEGVSLDEMPISMKKKWTKAQYGRERYLATEFLKSKSEQMTEGKLTEDKFIAFYKKDRVTVNAKSLWDAKKQIIAKLKVPKKDVGLVSVLNKTEYDKQKFRFEQKLRKSIREIIKEQLNEKSFGDIRKIKFDKKDGKKIANIITSKKYKLTTPLYKIKGKDIELHIPKKEYNKAVEFFMKNKLNPRG